MNVFENTSRSRNGTSLVDPGCDDLFSVDFSMVRLTDICILSTTGLDACSCLCASMYPSIRACKSFVLINNIIVPSRPRQDSSPTVLYHCTICLFRFKSPFADQSDPKVVYSLVERGELNILQNPVPYRSVPLIWIQRIEVVLSRGRISFVP